MLRDNPSRELLEATDRSWYALARFMSDQRTQGGLIPDDIDTAGQYMVEHDAHTKNPKIRLVDIPCNTIASADDELYDISIVTFAGAVHEIEHLASTQMTLARAGLYEMLQLHKDSEHFGNGVWAATAKVLVEGLSLLDGDEHIEIDDLIMRLGS